MADESTLSPAPQSNPASAVVPPTSTDSGFDAELVAMLAPMPLIALGFTALAWLSTLLHPLYGPVVCISLGMLVCAIIDGWYYKVPNWMTIPLILSGWMLGILHDVGFPISPAVHGGFLAALGVTAFGFLLLFPILFVGGMGDGDVKMQMGFGSWVGAMYGAFATPTTYPNGGIWIVLMAFVIGALTGGVFGLVMMLLRWQFAKNVENLKEIGKDMQMILLVGIEAGAARARSRRPSWTRLPYGVPLCVGFIGFLAYLAYMDYLQKAAALAAGTPPG